MWLSLQASARRTFKRVAAGLVLACVVVGFNCDHNAQTAFREAAVGPIGDGVKSIMDGTLEGIIAALENAGDGSNDSSTANSSTNSNSTGTGT